MTKNYWLVKQEPESYAWEQFARDKKTAWTGVRNFQARNHLSKMNCGDAVLYYHSGDAKEIVGVACVARNAYADPTAREGDWLAVDLAALMPFKKPVTLAEMKGDPAFTGLVMLRQPRLSVVPVSPEHFRILVAMGFNSKVPQRIRALMKG